MGLIAVKDVTVRFTDPPLLDKVSFHLEENERIGLMGRNGTGKSTLMKMLAGEIIPEAGTISRKPGLRVAYLPQEVPTILEGRVFDIVDSGHQSMDIVHNAINADEEWKRHQQVDRILSLMQLEPDWDASLLSAGWKRRVFLARGLVRSPQVLLLDEPTNHLDIESIDWLERLIQYFDGTVLFVTHDRVFLKKLSTRILEIDGGKVLSWECNYDNYLQRKEEALDNEQKNWDNFDKKLAQEEVWLRRGPKARRSRNEGRVRALKKMRDERRQRRERLGNVKFRLQDQDMSGELVIEANDVCFSYQNKEIIKNFSLTLMRGDKVGIIGPNGVGKTTLLKVLLKNLEPVQGKVKHGTKLEIAYFDQLRSQLNDDATVVENVGEGSDRVTVNGQSKHIYGYLNDFLFTPERAKSPVRILSGGERNRVLLAKMFTKPSNVFVLDEPTNDLDFETLELLESMLVDFPGTVLLVSHDREFLNNVVTGTLAFEGDGAVREYVGGYDDWLWQRKQERIEKKETQSKEDKTANLPSGDSKRLSYNEKRKLQAEFKELQDLPQQIEAEESEIKRIHLQMSDPQFYKQPIDMIANTKNQLDSLDMHLKELYKRWEELEEQFLDVDLKQIQ